MFQTGYKLILDGISRATDSVASWAASLNHETINNSVEFQVIIETASAKFHKVLNCNGRLRGE